MSIKWNSAGFEQILCCEGATEVCRQQAERICASANSMNRFGGDGFDVHTEIVNLYKSNRAAAYVKARGYEAIKACAEDKVLERSI